MAREIRLRTIKRKPIDEDKLALAFLLLAKSLSEDEQRTGETASNDARGEEAA